MSNRTSRTRGRRSGNEASRAESRVANYHLYRRFDLNNLTKEELEIKDRVRRWKETGLLVVAQRLVNVDAMALLNTISLLREENRQLYEAIDRIEEEVSDVLKKAQEVMNRPSRAQTGEAVGEVE
jgi:hypothetical protein